MVVGFANAMHLVHKLLLPLNCAVNVSLFSIPFDGWMRQLRINSDDSTKFKKKKQ